MSDPYVYPDEKNHVYYLTGTGGRQYRSNDLKTWTGPYPIIDLSGTWMEGLFVAAAEIHHIGNKYYYAGTWSDHRNHDLAYRATIRIRDSTAPAAPASHLKTDVSISYTGRSLHPRILP